MNITNNTNHQKPAFKTAIKIVPNPDVSPGIMEIVHDKDGAFIHHACNSICDKIGSGIRKNKSKVYTDGVATCSVAVFVDKVKKVADTFAHIIPKDITFENFHLFKDNIGTPTNAIIVGSKGSTSHLLIQLKHPRTGELFKTLENVAHERNIPVSCIGDMQYNISASVYYSGDKDELYLAFYNIDTKKYVSSFDEFKNVCKDIRIAEGDTLEFLA